MNTHTSREPAHRATTVRWLLLTLALLLWFGTLGWRDLIHPDEGRYAELGRHMLISGDWISPRLNGILYFEKPALQYWATAAAFAVFGVNEWAARLWPALTAALAVLGVWWVARRAHGPRDGLRAACVLGASAWWIGNAHFLNLDMGLAASMTAVLLGFLVAQRDTASPRESRLGMLLAWAAMALAVLSKGLVGLVLPGAVLVAYTILARDLRIWRRMHWLPGIALFALIAVPWFVLVSMQNPDFARFFFIHEHFERFLTTQHRRTGAWWYFVPVLALGLMPWTTLLPGALLSAWRREPGHFQPGRLLLVWAVVIFLFFSASGSKLPSYILPIFPALALLIARRLDTLPPRWLARHALAVAACAMLLGGFLLLRPEQLARLASAPSDMELAYRQWLLAGCLTLVVAGASAALLASRMRGDAAVLALAFGSLIGVQLMMLGHQNFARIKSAKAMVETIRPLIEPNAPVFSIGTYDQSLPFYLGRPVTLVAWVDEFATGLRIEPQRHLPTETGFEAVWRATPGAVALMRTERHAAYLRDGLPMRLLWDDGQRIVVIRP